MKLIIQIPCYNEEQTLGLTLSGLPRQLVGIDSVEWLVVDDGSHDGTAEVAKAHGVDHIVSFSRHQGLAKAFQAGLLACLQNGADIIVNTDGDNQYRSEDISRLIAPILNGNAEMVLGARALWKIGDFSLAKKLLHQIGSVVVSIVSGFYIPDPTTGFRAIHAPLARRLEVTDEHTYTIETLVQIGNLGVKLLSIPIQTNRALRPSRLIRSLPHYLWNSTCTIFRTYFRFKWSPLNIPIRKPKSMFLGPGETHT